MTDFASSRDTAMDSWLQRVLGGAPHTLAPASGDASFRRYLRLTPAAGPTLVVMDSPPEHYALAPFLDIADRLERAGVRVPAVLAADPELGFALLEDFGSAHYLDRLREGDAERLYAAALDTLLRIQQDVDARDLPAYDEALLRRELDLFPEWLLERHLGLDPGPAGRRALDAVAAVLVGSALEQPVVPVHRDYHARNLMVLEGDGSVVRPGVLDFQDAVVGPLTYDPVSLLRDCYIAWPPARVEHWIGEVFRRQRAAGLLPPEVPWETYRRWLGRMGVQRHLKAAGIFARLHHRDGRSGYLADIPRTLGYVRQEIAEDPALRPLGDLLDGLEVEARLGSAGP